ncbi:Ig-like domain-containing alpha-2-macroglobulin family protein [Corallococcus aberystwythensis]|uniref:Alpha-2-macroglobulin n=1 Tax=Corallococcus aberystwythensis TaxID=2316722 RepID=A0A3A8PHT2_9BACT|nr:Ig-like domain-containing alpha-2-macroglobulin family protein [Corallococcus aberystwythensis]RKH55569.1 alpha-2-macroglobulin [Corallococcus aberystwythensis]
MRRLSLLALCLVVATTCSCGDKDKNGGPPQPGTAPAATSKSPGIAVEPLPEPPALKIDAQDAAEQGPLSIAAVRPEGQVFGPARPTITFTKPMIALGSVAAERGLAAPAKIAPALEGEWRWLGSASVEFVPSAPAKLGTQYTVTVPAGLKAMDGTALAEPYTFQFETPRPSLQFAKPEADYRWVQPDQSFELTFNQAVKDLAQHARLEPATGAPVPLTLVKTTPYADVKEAQVGSGPERKSQDRRVKYELKAAQKLPAGTQFTLVVDGELTGTDGPLPMGEAVRYAYATYGALTMESAGACVFTWGEERCSYGPLILFTSNELDAASLKGKVTLEPKAEIDWERVQTQMPYSGAEQKRPYVSLPGRYRPGTTYKIKVAAGYKDLFGQTGSAFQGEVKLADVEPSFDSGSREALVEASGDGSIPLMTINVPEVQAEVWSLSPAQLAQLIDTNEWPSTEPYRTTVDTKSARNVERTSPLNLRPAFNEAKTGLFLARLTAPSLKERYPRRVIGQVTDLAVHAKLGAASGVVWVTSLATGAPVPDAQLTLWDKAGTEHWTGKTDANGLAKVPGLSELLKPKSESSWDTPWAMVSAVKDADIGVTLSTWEGGMSPGAFSLQSAWEGRVPDSLGFVFADRGIYRPGDDVMLKGVARYRRLGVLKSPPANAKAQVTVTSSRGEKVFQTEAAVTKYGTFRADLKLGKDMPLGYYEVAAKLKVGGESLSYGGTFRVEEYRAPQFRVDVAVTKKDVAAGEPLTARVDARYLFGGAMGDAQVRWNVQRASSFFTPPGNEAFTFGVNTWWWDDEQPENSSESFGSGDGRTDAQGQLALALGTADAPGGKTWEYTLEAEVEDVNRQRVANRNLVIVHPADVYAGLRMLSTGFAEAGKEVGLEVVAVSPEGKRQEGVAVDVNIKRREWKSIRKKGDGGQWFTVTEPVETDAAKCSVKSAATPQQCKFTPAEPGLYVMEAVATDAKGRKATTRDSLYVTGSGWVSWQRNDTDRIDLVADKQLYDVGDTAKVLVKSPYPQADALVTVEREGVLSVRRVKLKGSATALDIPLGEGAIPNVFVGVVLVRGRVEAAKGIESGDDPGRPAVRVGYTQLKVEKKSKRLSVALTPDAPEKRPRDKVTVNVAVKDSAGQGAKAEVTLWAVDEGVLRLTGYKAPDPLDAMFQERGLSVRIGEPLIHLVLRKLYGEKGSRPGGSGGSDTAGSGIRSNFKTTAVFQSVETDDQGQAKVEFTLPDNLTTFRIMAVAVTDADRFGVGESKVQVAKPLLALPALPRLVRVGDKAEAGVVIHTTNPAIKEAKVTAKLTGVRVEGPSEKTVQLDGKAREVRFTFVAEQPGTAVLQFAVSGGGETDAVEQKLPVQLPVGMEAVAVYGDTTNERVEGLKPPGGVRPGMGGLTLTMSSTVMGGFDESMNQLVDYPYGCLEQMSSRLVPFVALRELSGKFGVAWTGGSDEQKQAFIRGFLSDDALKTQGTLDPDAVVTATVRKIEALQNHDGGFRFWASSDCSSPYASAYATLALARAKEVGYAVNASVLDKAKKFLADKVAAGVCTQCSSGCNAPGLETRAFALYTLARMGAPRPSYYNELFEQRQKLPLFARAMLTDAIFVGKGNRAQGQKMLQELLNTAQESAAGVHFQETDAKTYAPLWSSDTRTTALVLQTLVSVQPDHPYVSKMGRYLASAREGDGRFRNTQEAAFTLMALSEVVRRKETAVPSFEAVVRLGGQVLASADFRGRDLGVKTVQVPVEKLGPADKAQPFTFGVNGTGNLYYGALLRYAPAQLPVDPMDRGIIVQRWFEPYSGGGQAKAARAGELVRVRVRVATPMRRNFVAVDVPLPAGLEPVDTSLASTASLPGPAGSGEEEGPGEGYEYESEEDLSETDEGEGRNVWATRFWSPFNHTEMRDDRVVFFADELPPGVHVTSFVARATTPGDFLLKPAHAEEMYTPEVFGRSEGGRFPVLLPEEVASK